MLALLLPYPSLSAQNASIRPFVIEVEDAVLEDLEARLAQTRWPAAAPAGGWQYGVDPDYMKDLVAHWRSNYDWRAWEKKLNAFDIRKGGGVACQRVVHKHVEPCHLCARVCQGCLVPSRRKHCEEVKIDCL